MSNNLDEILSLTREITHQDVDDFDITVTEYGEQLSKINDIEFLWKARNTTSTVKKATTNIKSFNDQNIAKNVEENGPVRLGDEVFVFNKSYNWKVQDLRKFIENEGFKINFEKCISNKKLEDFVLNDRIEATKNFKINATPTIIINDKKFEKTLNYKNLKKSLEKLI